jgi:hypothetical protein
MDRLRRWLSRRPTNRVDLRRARVTALALLAVTAALAVLVSVLSHQACPPVLVSILGTVPALCVAWLAVPGVISPPEPAKKLAHGRPAAQWNPVDLGVHQVIGGGPMPCCWMACGRPGPTTRSVPPARPPPRGSGQPRQPVGRRHAAGGAAGGRGGRRGHHPGRPGRGPRQPRQPVARRQAAAGAAGGRGRRRCPCPARPSPRGPGPPRQPGGRRPGGGGDFAVRLDELREAGDGDAITTLADRAVNAGRFDLFLKARPDEAPSYRFGREPNGAPSQSWRWKEPWRLGPWVCE